METLEPSTISPLIGTVVHRPSDLLSAPVSLQARRGCARSWMRSLAPALLIPAPLVALNAWIVIKEAWVTQRRLTRMLREQEHDARG